MIFSDTALKQVTEKYQIQLLGSEFADIFIFDNAHDPVVDRCRDIRFATPFGHQTVEIIDLTRLAMENVLQHGREDILMFSKGNRHEAFRDGHNCSRILDAVDDFIANYQGRLAPKPKNLSRKLIQRWQVFRGGI